MYPSSRFPDGFMRRQEEGAERATLKQALDEEELCSFLVSVPAYAEGRQFQRGELEAARRPVGRHADLLRKKAGTEEDI
jgi:hypothetical protein